MPRKFRHDIVHRWEGNPIIALDNLPFVSNNVYSAAAVKLDGHYLLLVTIENLEGKPSIYPARSETGFHFTVDEQPFLGPEEEGKLAEFEGLGVREARVTFLDGKYYIIYLGVGHHGKLLCLASTTDFKTVEKHGIISEPETKAGALFPRKFKGKYLRLDRPQMGGSIWLSYSRDLLTWGESKVVISPRNGFWDSGLVGCAFPPMEIEEGWLLAYYGIKPTSTGPITRLGAAVLERENPCKVIARCNVPILSPRKDYERIGDFTNVVFSSGAVLEDNGELKIYYGAADNCLCAGTTKLSEVVNECFAGNQEF